MSAATPRLSQARVVVVLGLLVALGPLTTDMYLPALPDIRADLHVGSTLTQLTLTGTLLGLSVGELVVGPLSDSIGRRAPLIAGAIVHTVASLAIMVAPGILTLGMLRAVQGFGAAAVMVVAMAVVRDLYSGRAAATVISRLSLIIGAAPILAPSLGVAVLAYGSWRYVFGALSVISLLLLILAVTALPETMAPSMRRPVRMDSIMSTYRTLLTDRVFVALMAVTGVALSGLYAYIAGSSFVLQDQYGMDKQTFGFAFGAGSVAFVAASQLNIVFLKRYEPQQIMTWCLRAALIPGTVLLVVSATGVGGAMGFLVPVWALVALTGFVIPNAPALGLSRHGEAAATSAALLGAAQFGVGAAIAPLVGALGDGALGMSVVMVGGVILGLVGMAVIRGRTSGGVAVQ